MTSPDLTLPHVVVHIRTQRCLHCGSEHKYSNVFECITKGKTKQLLPCRTHFPIDYSIVPTILPTETVPICHSCVEHTAITDSEAARRWSQTLMRKAQEQAAAPPTTSSSTRTIPTPEML